MSKGTLIGIIVGVLVVGLGAGTFLYVKNTGGLSTSASVRSTPRPSPTVTPIPDGCGGFGTVMGTVLKKSDIGTNTAIAYANITVSTDSCKGNYTKDSPYTVKTQANGAGVFQVTVPVPTSKTTSANYTVIATKQNNPAYNCMLTGSSYVMVAAGQGADATVYVTLSDEPNCQP